MGTGRLWDGEKDAGPFTGEVDYVIVGSGAAGATAARTLVDLGAEVLVVEEGPAVRTEEFGDRMYNSLTRLFRDMGANVARGRALVPVLQGRCLGGSTVINSAIVWRIPDDVWAPWRDTFGLGEALPLDGLHACWDQIEAELGVHPVLPEVQGENNRLMEVAARRLGKLASPIRRYEKGCRGTARCLTGCPHGAKQSMLVSYLPYARERGATLLTSAYVEKVVLRGDRAVGVRGHFRETGPRKRPLAPFEVKARRGVVVAASAIQTPGVLARSGVRGPHLGRHFQAHPGCALIGIFDQKVNMWFGATQGYDADHHRIDHRFKIETISFPPELLLSRFPGVGAAWMKNMALADHCVGWAVQLRARAEGRVAERFFGLDITYDFTEADMRDLRVGVRFTAELMFAAGAREILLGIHGLPERLTSPDQLSLLDAAPLDPSCYQFIMSHLFGTARMSLSPSDGVVGPDFNVHGTRNLWVLDSSIFPTNLGVNPQHSIMAVSMMGARRLAAA